MENLVREIFNDVEDIFNQKIETTKAYVVPSRDDSGLTFNNGESKKGKVIETCVLMVDIRNSTKISKQLRSNKAKLGKIYSAFIHAMTKIADEYGFVRNIVGDRVMVVFDPKDCYANALTCAILMNSVALNILTKKVGLSDFKVGIGIDFGEMLVLKTGIPKKHEEQSEYKSLVWVGDAANIASKLTDMAGKEIKIHKYRVRHEPLNVAKHLGLSPLFSRFSKPSVAPDYLPMKESIFTSEEIMNSLYISPDRKTFSLFQGRINSIEKLTEETIKIPEILMTATVYNYLKEHYSDRVTEVIDPGPGKIKYRRTIYPEVSYPIKDVEVKVYGGNRIYSVVKKIAG